MTGPVGALLDDGRRLHLQHGPIDLVIEAWGGSAEVERAYGQAATAFDGLLQDLVADLDVLRRPVATRVRHGRTLRSVAATRMIRAARRHAPAYVTPMAAVAGAVADWVLVEMSRGRKLDRAYVNNGGDIAVYLAPGTHVIAAAGPNLSDRVRIAADDQARGIATSGWRGRSHSLGIADAVTVLARSAAEADIAATLIANAVDLPGHAAVARRPAQDLAPDSDLGETPVTTGVDPLTDTEIDIALQNGKTCADEMLARGLIDAATLWLQNHVTTVGAASPAKKDLLDA
ncbi:MAG: UPF0280 family protein [Pseudomonadota bacterium]